MRSTVSEVGGKAENSLRVTVPATPSADGGDRHYGCRIGHQQQEAGVAAAGSVPGVVSVPQQVCPVAVGSANVGLSASTV